MANASDAKAAIKKIAAQQANEGVEFGTVGVPDGDYMLVDVPNRPGYIYVVLESGTVVEANDANSLVSHEGGDGVRVRWTNGEYVVEGPDIRGGAGAGGGTGPGGGIGPHDHAVGSGREYFHPGELFKPLGLDVLDSASLRVRVYGGFYVYEGVYRALPEQSYDLSASVPATSGGLNQYRYAIVAIDGATGSLVTINTTPRFTADLQDSDVAAATLSRRYLPLGAVRLVSGQTAINDLRTFRDLRAGYAAAIGTLSDPLKLGAPGALTIASGSITVTQTYHTVDTEGAAASDDLTSISLAEGQVVILRAANTARTVVIKDGANIVTNTGSDYALDDDNKLALLIGKSSTVALMYPIGTGGGGTGDIEGVTAGEGLSGGGTSGTVTLNVDIDGLPSDATPDVEADYVMTYDADADALKKVLLNNLPTAGSGNRAVLYDNTLAAAGAWDVSGISQDYTHLEIIALLRGDRAQVFELVWMLFNNDTAAANYRSGIINTSASTGQTDNPRVGTCPAANSASDEYGILRVWIPFYTMGQRKHVNAFTAERQDATTMTGGFHAMNWENNAAINRIMLRTQNHPTDQFVAGSRLQIIGHN